MTSLQALILGIVQGITEFLPISSSGHLVLVETWLGLDVASLKDFDVVVHVGTLLAILSYFWKDLQNRSFWPYLIVGTIPAVFVGLLLEDPIDSFFRSATRVGLVMCILGLIFLIPEGTFRRGKKSHQQESKQPAKLTFGKALLIGTAQAVAIIPGVSRSGSTIFAGTALGLDRSEAARFSFLLGSIAIFGAGLLTSIDLSSTWSETSHNLTPLIVGFVSSFASGYIAVKWLMHYLKKHSLQVFGIYLLLLGSITLLFF